MVLCVDYINMDRTLSFLKDNGENAWVLGKVTTSKKEDPKVKFN